MDSPGGGASQSSAWGGFLKKAMEGVEQQLDRVLENPPPKGTLPWVRLMVARDAANAVKRDVGNVPSRVGSGSGRMTLQERLAASVAKSRTGSPKIGSEEGSLGTSERSSGDHVRSESNGVIKDDESVLPEQSEQEITSSPTRIDAPALEVKDLPSRTETPDIQVIPGDDPTTPSSPIQTREPPKPEPSPPKSSTPISFEPPPSPARSSSSQTRSIPSLTLSIPQDTDPATAEIISQLRADLETCESRRVEELQASSERITSLETKLKILSQETADSSNEVSFDSSAGTWERKLADREGKIALLLDEGEKLAKIELNLMTTIKGLRAKQKEDEKTTVAAVSRAERAEKQAIELKAQLKKANEIEKKNTERLKGMYRIEASNEALRREKEAAQVSPTPQPSSSNTETGHYLHTSNIPLGGSGKS
jgi:TATA element modulatory factor